MTRTSPSSDADRSQAPHTGPSGVFAPPLRLLTIGLLVSVGIVAFDGLGVTTAMPQIASDLGGMSTYGWAVSALMLVSVVGTVVGGYLADRTGPRRPYLAGLVVFIAGLLISATAPSWPIFLLGRAVQGLGVGAVMSMAYAVVAIAFPQRLQARALALLSGRMDGPGTGGADGLRSAHRDCVLAFPLPGPGAVGSDRRGDHRSRRADTGRSGRWSTGNVEEPCLQYRPGGFRRGAACRS